MNSCIYVALSTFIHAFIHLQTLEGFSVLPKETLTQTLEDPLYFLTLCHLEVELKKEKDNVLFFFLVLNHCQS